MSDRTGSRTVGLRLLAAATASLCTLGAGVAFGQSGGTGSGDEGSASSAPGCSGAGASAEQPDFDLERREADPPRDYPSDGIKPDFAYRIGGVAQPVDLEIQVVNRDTDTVVKRYCPNDVPPETGQHLEWDNTTSSGEKAPKGRYKFRTIARDGDSPDIEAPPEHKFQWRGHIFPVRGSHTYGDGLGAGRGHQGQDVFAACGTPLKAAHGGTVEWKAYQGSGAGYYIVIDRADSARDYVYMHLKNPGAVVSQGETVQTRQLIGYVGQSGNASGCHLHFELWNGWRNDLVDPTPRLRKWDTWS